jgi:hypothetical protein
MMIGMPPTSTPTGYRYERIRYELKYPVQPAQVRRVLDDMAPYLLPDSHGLNGQYVIYSVYFDTPRLTCYYDKLDGFANRVKFRLRTYLGSHNPVWFLESKERVRHYIAKHRIRLTAAQADRLLMGQLTPGLLIDVAEPHHPLLLKLVPMLAQGVFQPVVAVYYHRHAFTMPGTRDVRVTYDHNLIALPPRVTTATLPNPLPTQPMDTPLIEIKGNGMMPTEVLDTICRHGLTATSFSKYCQCLERMRPWLLPATAV